MHTNSKAGFILLYKKNNESDCMGSNVNSKNQTSTLWSCGHPLLYTGEEMKGRSHEEKTH